MLEIFIIGYCLYFAVSLYTHIAQMRYIKLVKKNKAIILDEDKYEQAGDYAIEKERSWKTR